MLFLVFARSVAFVIDGNISFVTSAGGFVTMFEFLVEVLFAGRDFVDAFFGCTLGHFGEFGVVFDSIGDTFSDSFLFSEGE